MPSERPVLPPPPADQPGDSSTGSSGRSAGSGQGSRRGGERIKSPLTSRSRAGKQAHSGERSGARASSASTATASTPQEQAATSPAGQPTSATRSGRPRTRTAHLRLARIDPLSVMKMAFLLSIALGIVLVVAVTIIWSVLSAVGVWDNVNAAVQQVIGTESGDNFDVSQYVGTPRVIGFSLIASVINVVLLTAIATLSAFVYNLAAALLGGVEMTWAEDR